MEAELKHKLEFIFQLKRNVHNNNETCKAPNMISLEVWAGVRYRSCLMAISTKLPRNEIHCVRKYN